MASYLHLVGGRTLDNLWGLLDGTGANYQDAKGDSIAGLLQTQIGGSYRVCDHAFHGFSGQRIVEGRTIQGIFLSSDNDWKKRNYLKARGVRESDLVQPLVRLAEQLKVESKATHYVVISDYLTLKNLRLILNRVNEHTNVRPIVVLGPRTEMIDKSSPKYAQYSRYAKIACAIICLAAVAAIASGCALIDYKINRYIGSAILLASLGLLTFAARQTIFRRMVFNVLTGKDAVNGQVIDSIMKLAKEHKVPVLDLINTFKGHQNVITNGGPNKAGGQLIAQGISAILTESPVESRIYLKDSRSPNFTAIQNTGSFVLNT